MFYLTLGILIILAGLRLLFGDGPVGVTNPLDFGEYNRYVGAAAVFLGVLLVRYGIAYVENRDE